MSDAPPTRRSLLARTWGGMKAGASFHARPWGRALDVAGIQTSWNLMRDVQRRAFTSREAPVSGIRLIEKDGRLDVEATRAWMEAYTRGQFEAGRTTQDMLDIWETATPAGVTLWAVHEVRANRPGVYLKIGKAVACGLAAVLSIGLVTPVGMARISGLVLMVLFVILAIASVRAIEHQIYLESLIRENGE